MIFPPSDGHLNKPDYDTGGGVEWRDDGGTPRGSSRSKQRAWWRASSRPWRANW